MKYTIHIQCEPLRGDAMIRELKQYIRQFPLAYISDTVIE